MVLACLLACARFAIYLYRPGCPPFFIHSLGHFAQSKGRNIGVYEARDETPERRAGRMERLRAEAERVDVFGTHVYARSVPPGGKLLAVASSDTPERTIDPASVDSYLRRAFGDKLEVAKRAMQRLAGAVPPSQLDHHALAYKLYEQVRQFIVATRHQSNSQRVLRWLSHEWTSHSYTIPATSRRPPPYHYGTIMLDDARPPAAATFNRVAS